MNKNLKREVKALHRIRMMNLIQMDDGYITAQCVRVRGKPSLFVYVDVYQLIRDWRGLPDKAYGLGRDNWNVDKWESARHVVFWGEVHSSRQFRDVMLTAQAVLADVLGRVEVMFPAGRRNESPMRPQIKGLAERHHRRQRCSDRIWMGL